MSDYAKASPKEIREIHRKMRDAEVLEVELGGFYGPSSVYRERARIVKLYWSDRWYATGFQPAKREIADSLRQLDRMETEIKRLRAKEERERQ